MKVLLMAARPRTQVGRHHRVRLLHDQATHSVTQPVQSRRASFGVAGRLGENQPVWKRADEDEKFANCYC